MLPETETQISRARAIGRVAASAVLVGVAYYVGAKVGLVLRLPPAMSSVVWPPNSILTATLLLSSPRRWWPYLLVWRTRFFSNALTELTVVPAILTVAAGAPAWLRRASPRRRVEAGLIAVSLLAVAFVSFAAEDGPAAIDLNPSHSPLVSLMPFLLWAAVRFGPAGASLSLLTTALVAIWAGTQGRGPFTRLPAAQSVFALQIFLIAVAIPLMCLGALIEERRRVEKALGGRLRFEQFLARLSAAFVHLPSHDIDAAIASWLRSLGEFLRHD